MVHPMKEPQEHGYEDALALLDTLAFLVTRIQDEPHGPKPGHGANSPRFYIAIDGDDVGRRFESLLTNSRSDTDFEIRAWSLQIQNELSYLLLDLTSRWDATPLAMTGDGFLASVPREHIDEVKETFRPRFSSGITASTGLGPSIKDAYLALKLCKASNRGGGLYYSKEPPAEDVAWIAQ
jgi:hypothetical protein